MKKYTSVLKSRPYLYLEMKKASKLKLQGFSDSDIRSIALKENIFLVNTEARKKEISSTIINRMKALDDYILEKIINSDVQTSKQLALYSIMKTDLLFFEFMQEVYKEKMILKDITITDKDFNIFFRRKSEQSKQISSWQEYTFYKLKQVYKRILSEAGFIKSSNKEIEIAPQTMDLEIQEYLKNIGDTVYIKAMLGEM